MDFSTCKPVKQLLSKYPNTNLVDIVNLCKDVVSIKSCRHPKKTVIYDSERVKSMRKRKRVKKYYNITKEELILALQNKQGETQKYHNHNHNKQMVKHLSLKNKQQQQK